MIAAMQPMNINNPPLEVNAKIAGERAANAAAEAVTPRDPAKYM
jgi:hypothetical protein